MNQLFVAHLYRMPIGEVCHSTIIRSLLHCHDVTKSNLVTNQILVKWSRCTNTSIVMMSYDQKLVVNNRSWTNGHVGTITVTGHADVMLQDQMMLILS